MPTERGDTSAAVGGTGTDVPSTFDQTSLNGVTTTGNAKLVVRDATQIDVIDTNSYFTKTTVEGCLEEIAQATLGVINWGVINGTLSDQTDLQAALDAKVDDTEIASVDGTAEASKLFKLDANSDVSGINDLVADGDIEAQVVVANTLFTGQDAILTGDIDASTGTIDTLDGTDATFDSIVVPAGTPYDHQNLVINGNMIVAQAGNNWAAAASGTHPTDMWEFLTGGTTAVFDLYNGGSDFPADTGLVRTLEAYVNTVDTSIAAGDFSFLSYRMEGKDYHKLLSSSHYTVSFWLKTANAETICVAFRNDALNRSYVKEVSSPAATWTKHTLVIPRDTVGTWLTDNNIGLDITFSMVVGSTFQGSADTWQAGNYIGTSNQTNVARLANGSLQVTGLKLQPGQIATPFNHEPMALTQIMCRRYYNRLSSNIPLLIRSTTDTDRLTDWHFPIQMRATPTVTGTVSSGTFTSYSGTSDFMARFGTAAGNTTSQRWCTLVEADARL